VTRTFRTPLTLSHMGDFKGTLSFSEDIYLIQNKLIVFNFLLESLLIRLFLPIWKRVLKHFRIPVSDIGHFFFSVHSRNRKIRQ
jgi:hypothetical protein